MISKDDADSIGIEAAKGATIAVIISVPLVAALLWFFFWIFG